MGASHSGPAQHPPPVDVSPTTDEPNSPRLAHGVDVQAHGGDGPPPLPPPSPEHGEMVSRWSRAPSPAPLSVSPHHSASSSPRMGSPVRMSPLQFARKLSERRSSKQDALCINEWLPEDVLQCIFSYLNVRDLTRVAAVCTAWRELSRESHVLRVLNMACVPHCTTADLHTLLQTRCRMLRKLFLRTADITPQTMAIIAQHCAHLRVLSFADCRGTACITDASLSTLLRVLPHLRVLDVSRCTHLTDATLATVGKHSASMQSLRLFGLPNITNAGLIQLAQGAARVALRELSVRRCDAITSHGVRVVCEAMCATLDTLVLAECRNLTDECVAAVARCAHLTTLNVAHCTRLSDAALCDALHALPHLRHVSLSSCAVGAGTIMCLTARCPALVSAYLRACEVTDECLCALADRCLHLRYLSVSQCARITDAGVAHLARCAQLRALVLVGCTLSRKATRHLQRALPQCDVHVG